MREKKIMQCRHGEGVEKGMAASKAKEAFREGETQCLGENAEAVEMDVRDLIGLEPLREGVPCIAWDAGRGCWLDLVTGRETLDWKTFIPSLSDSPR